jgi:hypothetical protein
MADIDPQLIAALNEAYRTGAISSAQLGTGLANLGGEFKKFASVNIKNVADGLTSLHKEVKGGTKNFKDIGSELQYYKKQLNNAADGKEKEAAQVKLGILAQKAYQDSLASGAKEIGVVLVKGLYDYYKRQVMTGVRGLQGDGSPFQVAADLQREAIDSVASTAGQLGSTIGKVGQGLMMIPHPAAMVVGALMNIGGGILESGAKEAAELLKFKLEVVSKELEKSYKSFQQATAAGALFAGGMTELRNVGLAAGLTQEQFSKVIADNSSSLASFGGDVTEGGKKLSRVISNYDKDTKKQLLNLGISVEDQAQGVADYMSMLQRTGNLRGQSDAQLAEESKNYMVQLKAIASFTGEDAKKAEARAKQAAAQGAVAAKLQDLGPEAAAKFNAAIKLLPESQQKAAQQMLAFGKIIDPELAMTLGPASTQLLSGVISDVKDANVTAEGAQQNFYKTLDELSPALQSEGKKMAEIFGTVALANGQYANQSSIAADVLALANKNLRKTAEGGGGELSALDKAKLALATQDKLTNGVSDSVVALQEMKEALQDDLTPAIQNFAVDVPDILEAFREKMRNLGMMGDRTQPALTQPAQNVVNSSNALRSAVGLSPTSMTPKEAAAVERATERFNNSLTGELSNWITSWGKEKPKPNAQSPEILGPMADGGIASGPKSGFLANLHGTEAVVPLPNGRSIPIDMSSMAESLKSLLVPLPNGRSTPIDMSSMAERLGSLFGKKDNSIDEDFKRQLLENNNLVITALKQMQEIYTKSMETTKLVSSTIAADSEASAALLEAMNAVVGVLEDSKYELQDQSSSLKKLYDVTA